MNAGTALVDVCICAYRRRDGLRHCLLSLAAQVGAPAFRVIVADNHAEPMVAEWLAADRPDLPFDVRVLHAPASNISLARNACLEAAGADWIAFIDDDEVAAPDWLARLYGARLDAEVVFGPVRALYPADAPAWLRRGDFLSKRPAMRRGGYDTGHSANVLMRRAVLGSLRFDPALGHCGGEDTLFFARLHDAGARLALCEHAFVDEPNDPARCTFAALLRRSRASGQAHARVLQMRGQTAARIAIVAAAKCLLTGLWALVRLGSPAGWRRECLRASLHAGVVAQVFGRAAPRIYGSARP